MKFITTEIEKVDMKIWVESILKRARIDDRGKDLTIRYYLGKETLQGIAITEGVTTERIRQIITRTLRRIKEQEIKRMEREMI